MLMDMSRSSNTTRRNSHATDSTLPVCLPFLFFSLKRKTIKLIYPVNWYRTREINYKEELSILDQRITAPVLFIQALRDAALPPNLGRGMTKTIPHLTFKQVNTSHWALWEQPAEVNEMIAWWLEEVVFTDPRVLKL